MPVCYLCGKSLSTDQALTYHLNRKYKCRSWKCKVCQIQFNTKFDMNIHMLHCKCKPSTTKNEPIKIPCENTLIEIFNTIPLKLFVVDKQQHIVHCTPRVSERHVIGKSIHDVPNTEQLSEQIYMIT